MIQNCCFARPEEAAYNNERDTPVEGAQGVFSNSELFDGITSTSLGIAFPFNPVIGFLCYLDSV